MHVATDAAVKFWVLKVRNESGERDRLSATGYIEWVLGDLRAKSAMHVTTEVDPKTGALFARNAVQLGVSGPDRLLRRRRAGARRTVTGDRAEFLGRNGTMQKPAAMTRARLSGRVGATLDPCAAIQVAFELGAGQERQLVFRMGVGAGLDDARALVTRFRGPAASRAALESVWEYWKRTLGRRAGRDTRRITQRASQRLAGLPDAQSAGCGRAAGTTSPAAHSVFATSCRTSWR